MANTTKTLGKLFLKLELRTRDGSGRKLFLLILSYLLTGLFLPILLFNQNTDSTGFEYAFLTFLFYSMILIFTTITELDNLVISKPESDTLSFLPVEDQSIVNAKLYVLRRYIFIISLPLLLPGAFFYYFILHSVSHAVIYIASGMLLNTFVLSLLLFLYSFALRRLKTERISNYTLVLQVIMILIMVIGYQYISYSLSTRANTSIGMVFDTLESKNLLRFFPHAWFAFIAAKANYVPGYNLILKFILPFFIVFMSWLSLKYYLSDNYSRIHEKFMQSRSVNVSPDRIGANVNPDKIGKYDRLMIHVSRLYLNNDPQEQASFSLMRSMLKRDKAVRLNILLMNVIPAALAFFALITGQLPSPFKQFYLTSRPVFHISIMVTLFIVINTAILAVKVSNDSEASWIYEAYPLAPKNNFINGIRKFFFIYLILPVCVILFIIFFMRMSLYDALLHTLFILVSAELLNTIYHIFNRALPFTRINTLLISLQRIGFLLFPLAYGILFAVVQYFVYQSTYYTLISIFILAVLNSALVKFVLRKSPSR